MLPAKYIAFFSFVWITGALMGAILEEAFIGAHEATAFKQITSWQELTEHQSWGVFSIVAAPLNFFKGLFNVLTFNFQFIQGSDWDLFRYMVLMPLSALAVYGLIMTLFGMFRKNI